MVYTYDAKGTCSRKIIIDVENGVVNNVKFIGGCSGNTQGIASLAKGMKVENVIKKCKGIDCAGRGTSCPDQLAKAMEEIMSVAN
ncbi:MAG: TIGR03905 family TSCPD domain-containing protein [Acutalibacteraceae bacterium]|jgi:uncharacterized protein (TIGR03905 family)